jgi:DNA invertase Pin-like site-specific DNA recombinase
MTSTDRPWIIYLRLSDFRGDTDGFDGREARLRGEVARIGGTVARTAIENDLSPARNGKARPASAFKRTKIVEPDGFVRWRVIRAVFQGVLRDVAAGRANMMCEDLDRAARDPRDIEDLLDACASSGGSARSLTGTLTLTNGGQGGEIDTARIMVTMAHKASRDTARRVAAGRERLAGQSYGGGRRPYGFRPDPDAPEHHKRLIQKPAEAAVIRQAATDILDLGISLKAIARDLRERGVPTVTGTAWSAETLREAVIKPAVAGLAVKREDGERLLVPAPWEPILDRDRWEALRDKLTDPARRTNTGRVPRWLVSGFATCGVCGGRTRVIGGKSRAPAYTGAGCAHVRRNAAALDRYIAGAVVGVLSRPEAADLLRPPPRPEVDAGKLRAKARDLARKRKAQIAMHAEGILTDAELADSLRASAARLDAIKAQLAASDHPDPLPEFRPEARQGQTAEAVWDGLSLARKRAVVQTIIQAVVINRTGSRGRRYDIDQTVEVTPHPATLA